MKYQTIVGNIGTVYDGDNGFEARKLFHTYRSQSQRLYGRASGEPVTLFEDDEPILEYIPPGYEP